MMEKIITKKIIAISDVLQNNYNKDFKPVMIYA